MSIDNKGHYVAYVRVSSSEQAEKNISIPSQIDQVEQYALQNNIIIDQIIKEENSAFTGKRPQFHALLSTLKSSKHLKGLVVFKYDRISRNMDDFLAIDKIIREKEMEIISITEPLLNSYLGRYMIRDMQNRAVLYSEELSFRVKLGMRKKLQMGGSTGGKAPWGFKRVESYLLPDEERGPIVKKIFETYATTQYGYREIASMINKENANLKLTKKIIERMVNNPIYTGIKRKKRKITNDEYIFRGLEKAGSIEEEYSQNHITPIIDEELFQCVQQARILKNRVLKKKTGLTSYPKIFQCSCGRSLSRDDKKGNRYFKCSNHINHKFTEKCKEKYINIKTIETQLEGIISPLLPSMEQEKDLITHFQNEIKNEDSNKSSKLKEALHKIESTKYKLQELTSSYASEIISKEFFQQAGNTLQEEIEVAKLYLRGLSSDVGQVRAYRKCIELFQILGKRRDNLVIYSGKQKSSQLFSMFFHGVANSVVISGNITSYAYSMIFGLLQNSQFTVWCSRGDSNPQAEAYAPQAYMYTSSITGAKKW